MKREWQPQFRHPEATPNLQFHMQWQWQCLWWLQWSLTCRTTVIFLVFLHSSLFFTFRGLSLLKGTRNTKKMMIKNDKAVIRMKTEQSEHDFIWHLKSYNAVTFWNYFLYIPIDSMALSKGFIYFIIFFSSYINSIFHIHHKT